MLTLHHPSDCLTASRSTALDIAILRTASEIAHAANARPDIPADVARHMAQWADELKERAADIRATTPRPGRDAANLIDIIRHCSTAGDVNAAIVDHVALIRQMQPDDGYRVVAEWMIATCRQSMGDGR